ncbi:hypothetical protein [Gemella morbillorum]
MKKKIWKKIAGIFLSTSLIFTTVGVTSLDYADAKARARSSSHKSSKPSSSKSSSKPKASTSSKSSSSSKSTSSSSNSTTTRHFSSGSRYNSNYNSFNNEEYKKKYMNYLNNNYRSSGFFSRSSVLNGILWGVLFHNLSSSSNKMAHATNEQKELAENIKASKVPVYMIEVKTKNGETKYATVTKEQYEKIKEGDEISLKNGNLEIKSSKQ